MTQGEALDLPPGCFHPAPRVTSTFLCMSPRSDLLAAGELPALEGVLRAGFAHRRKTLVNSLARAADIDAGRAAAALRELGLDARSIPDQDKARARMANERNRGSRNDHAGPVVPAHGVERDGDWSTHCHCRSVRILPMRRVSRGNPQ